jgi:NADPH:quinone reductase
MSVPSTQKAVVFGTTSHSDRNVRVKTDYPVPAAEKGELLIRNTLCGVNLADTYYSAGFYTVSSPMVLGYEAIGTIVSLGPGTRWRNFKVGDRVLWVHNAGYAQYTAVPLDNIIKVPKGVLDHDAIGGFLNGMTALALTKELCKVNWGEWVLLHTDTSNIGILMVQILKSIGARVIGTAEGRANLSIIKNLGADVVINYADYIESGWVPKVKEITKGEGVSVVYDFVGKETWKGSLDAVKESGTVLWCGTLSGPVPPIPQK